MLELALGQSLAPARQEGERAVLEDQQHQQAEGSQVDDKQGKAGGSIHFSTPLRVR